MSAHSSGGSTENKKPHTRPALDPLVAGTSSSGPSKLELVQNALFARFSHKKHDSTKILSDLAPVIMTPRMINSAANASLRRQTISPAANSQPRPSVDFATLGRAPLRLGLGSRRITSGDLQIVEATDELLLSEIPEPDGVASDVSLLRGFNATIPSAEQGRVRRRQMRNVDTPRLGLKRLGMSARGLLAEEEDGEHDHDGQSVTSEDDVVVVQPGKGKRRGRESLSSAKILGKDELTRQTKEILRDKENIHVRRSLINNEIAEITSKIAALDGIRAKLEQNLLKLHEDELELEDELVGVKERLEYEQSQQRAQQQHSALPAHPNHASRRRKGPAFLPSEHDELPPGVAFMTLEGHSTPITALDLSEPYGTLVSASQDDSQPRVWDLFSGTEIGRLRGHTDAVKCLQVEDTTCLTGGADGNVRLWDLRKVDTDGWSDEGELVTLSEIAEEEEEDASGFQRDPDGSETSRIRGPANGGERDGCCTRVLEGHTKSVTALYFEDDCLVTGASDKTLRQWDLTTGQCVMTMDILWAMSHPPRAPGGLPTGLFSDIAPSVGTFAVPMPAFADGTWEMYEDFVGGVQFWGYGLVSGSGDGAVRMWDMRTGQAHRTLLGHTGAVTCLQFDEIHIASGSLDKTVQVWDLRTGGTLETLKYDHAVTALQFDTRKIVAASGENGIKVYNRTSQQYSTLQTNGHLRPVERLRYMDRYMVSGGRDATVKIWSL
ncbi:unnamed protein product [Mycena citricolor]|uniref:WD40 repeat-like protein n=1 Tax=Mycena citricolor TaxID=2018698 RepID=A0AAD2HQ15_9AGAR|nr:unnamed protein product [Mycena citricolor]CAK5280018.1 unnamed protein product [Mycena citricolor]